AGGAPDAGGRVRGGRPAPAAPPRGGPVRVIDVLLVDDDPQVCRYLEEMLTTDPGLRVVGHAHDGPDAVRRAVDLRPDVVLLDLRMPGGDGLEAIEPITRRGSRIVVLTAYDTDRDVDTALRRGASGFVLKSTD